MRARTALLLSALLVFCVSGLAAETSSARVRHVIDGDTLVLESGAHVRLIGIDAPEYAPQNGVDEPFGKKASEFLKHLAEGRSVKLETDVEKYDRYGRLLAYVWLEDGVMANQRLIEEGMARSYFVAPNGFPHRAELEGAERRAMEQSRGLWSAKRE